MQRRLDLSPCLVVTEFGAMATGDSTATQTTTQARPAWPLPIVSCHLSRPHLLATPTNRQKPLSRHALHPFLHTHRPPIADSTSRLPRQPRRPPLLPAFTPTPSPLIRPAIPGPLPALTPLAVPFFLVPRGDPSNKTFHYRQNPTPLTHFHMHLTPHFTPVQAIERSQSLPKLLLCDFKRSRAFSKPCRHCLLQLR